MGLESKFLIELTIPCMFAPYMGLESDSTPVSSQI